MRRTVVTVAALAVLASCGGDQVGGGPGRPPSSVAFEGTDAILYVDVADQTDEQRRGLMGLENLPADHGMAFVFDEPVGSTFWMKDTLIPLSIAFIDSENRVIGVRDMEPCGIDECPSYGVDEPFVVAIEANLGWFDEHGIAAGDRVELRLRADG